MGLRVERLVNKTLSRNPVGRYPQTGDSIPGNHAEFRNRLFLNNHPHLGAKLLCAVFSVLCVAVIHFFHISHSLPSLTKSRLRCNIKKNVVPLQTWSGPEGSRKLRFPDFMTTAQDGGKVVSFMHRPLLPPGNAPDTHFC